MRVVNLILIITLLLSADLSAKSRGLVDQSASFKKSGELRSLMLPMTSSSSISTNINVKSGLNKKYKNPVIGVAMSALLPGTGQAYTGSWTKAAIFIGVETILWYEYFKYSGRGKDWENTFHTYADTHWKKERWTTFYNPETDPSTHSLPDTKTQQYFEMIGKYDQFKQGWDDWYAGGPDLTPNRFFYEGLRHKSNDEFKQASYCAMLVLANHVISAFDTGFSIRRKNRAIKGDVNLSMAAGYINPVPVVNAVFTW